MKFIRHNWRWMVAAALVTLSQGGCAYFQPPTDRSPYTEEIDRSREPARSDVED